jgi:hypothetical protein
MLVLSNPTFSAGKLILRVEVFVVAGEMGQFRMIFMYLIPLM